MNRHGKQLIAAAMMLGSAVGGAAFAADEPAKPAAPGLADVLASSGITESGYIAASYQHSNGYPFNIHQFDVEHDSFQLDQAGLTLAYQPMTGFGGLVDLMAGEDARILHLAEDGNDTSFDVRQAYVQYVGGPLTVIAGKFLTLAGAEVINPTGNTNFSRSLLFFDAEPLTHTGIRATYAASGTLNLIFGVNNGWNTTSTSYGSKTGELGFGWTPNKTFALAGTAYFGKTPLSNGSEGVKTLVDIVATYNATSALTIILNYDWDKQENGLATDDGEDGTIYSDAKWSGVALYVNYAINDQWRLSARGEVLDDKDGALTGVEQKLKEFTLTFGYAPVKSFELRMEARLDKADEANTFFRTVNGPDADSLTGLAVQGVYKF